MDKKFPDGLYNLTPQHKDLFDVIIHDQVQVSLAVSRFHVREPVPFLGQWSQGFAEKNKFFCQDGQFAGSGAEKGALYGNMVPDVHQLEDLEFLIVHLVFSDIGLKAPCPVLDMDEGGLSEIATGDYPAGEAIGTALLLQGLSFHMIKSTDGL